MPADDDPIHVFNAMECSRVAGDVVLVRAETWRDAQGEIPDEDHDDADLEIEDDGRIAGMRLEADGDYPSLDYRGTWAEAGQRVEMAAREGDHLMVARIPHDDGGVAEVASDLLETCHEAERPGGTT